MNFWKEVNNRMVNCSAKRDVELNGKIVATGLSYDEFSDYVLSRAEDDDKYQEFGLKQTTVKSVRKSKKERELFYATGKRTGHLFWFWLYINVIVYLKRFFKTK